MKTLFAVLIASAASGPTLRAELAGLDYAKARTKLLADGWIATAVASTPGGGAAKVAFDRGWTEVESCTEGEVVCSFGFKRGEDCLHVVTIRDRVERIDRRCL